MSFFVTAIHTERFNAAMDSLYNAQKKDMLTILVEEVRKLIRTIINFTPPTPASGARRLGEKAVTRDVYRCIGEAHQNLIDEVGSDHGISNINAWVSKADGSKLHLLWEHLDPSGDRIAEYHQSYRNRLGRVSPNKYDSGVWGARVIVPSGTRKPYLDKVLARVGLWKATYAYVTSRPPFNDSFPRWISRHFANIGDKSTVLIDTNPEKPSITFTSRASGNDRLRQRIQGAVDFRVRTMLKNLKLIQSDYSKDVAKGIRVETQAHKHKSEAAESVE